MDLNRQLYRSNVTSGTYLENSISIVLKEISDNIATSYGPFGGHALISNSMGCQSTKDGLTILSTMQFDQSISKMVHATIKTVATRQVDDVGDGSTTTMLLLNLLYVTFKEIQKKYNISPSELKTRVMSIVSTLKTELVNMAIKIESVEDPLFYNTILTSVDGDVDLAVTIKNLFAEMTSIEPLIIIELSQTDSHHYSLTKGVEIDGTIIRPDVFCSGQSKMSYNNPYIVVVNGRVDISPARLAEIVDHTRKHGSDIIFLCSGISEDILNYCVTINSGNPGVFSRIGFFQIRQTSNQEEFMDLCAMLGANYVDESTLKRIGNATDMFNLIHNSNGTATKVTLSEQDARFSEPRCSETLVAQRVEDVDNKIKALKDDPTALNMRINDLEIRKAFLSNNYAKLYIGGQSPQRKSINYELAADAVPQAISSRKHGVVAGCNLAVPEIINKLMTKEPVLKCDDIDDAIFGAIRASYLYLFVMILQNKTCDEAKACEIVADHIEKNGYVPLNIRDGSDTIYNSADTDRAILEYSTDMAVLLATAKAAITPFPEFDILNKQQ